ncbi:O-antigen ligase family protein [Nonlabens agnitus]|nr:O-antigen ligase family protein [Nonlabens agnitus]
MSLFQHFPTVIDNDLGPYNIHPIYLSMHGAIAILMSLHLLSRTKSAKVIIILIVSNIIIAAFMLILIKKGPILSLIIAGLYYVISAGNSKTWTVLGLIALIFASVIIIHPKVNSKFSELLKIGAQDNSVMSSTNIRMEIYKCGKEIIPQAGILGFGVGDAREKLLDCYIETNENLALYKYNSHNQYLSIILRAGFLGLLLFAMYIIFLILGLKKNKGYIAISLILFYLLVMFSENILERENGVLYFSYFSAFLYVAFTAARPSEVEESFRINEKMSD